MTILKWTWKIIWRCVFIPAIFTLIVMIVSLFFINDDNQHTERGKEFSENYVTSYHNNSKLERENPNFTTKFNRYNSIKDKNYTRQYVEMEDSDFDLSGVISMIAFFGSFIFMVIYTILDIRDYRKKAKLIE